MDNFCQKLPDRVPSVREHRCRKGRSDRRDNDGRIGPLRRTAHEPADHLAAVCVRRVASPQRVL